jgi:hypothetical protein
MKISPAQVAFTDRSGTIAVDSVAQSVTADNTRRSYLLIQNVGSQRIWFNFGATATMGPGSVVLEPSGSMLFEGSAVPTHSVSVIGPVGAGFTVKEA